MGQKFPDRGMFNNLSYITNEWPASQKRLFIYNVKKVKAIKERVGKERACACVQSSSYTHHFLREEKNTFFDQLRGVGQM